MSLSRRQMLATSLATPALIAAAAPSSAGGHGALAQPTARSFIVGNFHVTTLLDGALQSDEPQTTFGMNVSPEEFSAASDQNFIAADSFTTFFTPVLVENGSERILFDTGLGRGGLISSLADAGVAPEDITHVVLTHMHPDHILGLMTDGAPTFPNAVYVTGATEYNFWTSLDAGNRVGDMVATMVTPLAEKMTFIDDGHTVVSGLTSMATFGHTPGHMGYMIDSGGKQMFIGADMTNHFVWSLAYPDWEVRFDMDKAAAAQTRRKILGMLAADKIPLLGYHMPFPAAGFVETRGDGFRWVPVTYQFKA